jgi:hypothetical protein
LQFESFELKQAQNFNNKKIKEVVLPNINEIFKEASNAEKISTLRARVNYVPGKI